ncbi:MAG: hypothetical protein ACM3U2_09335 [Deltaproteobacteria bacterium]
MSLAFVNGGAMQAATGDPLWAAAGTVLGVLDGVLGGLAILVLPSHRIEPSPMEPSRRNRALTVICLTLAGAALGLKIGQMIVGPNGMWACMAVNGLVGAFIAVEILHRIRKLEDGVPRAKNRPDQPSL